MIFRSLCVMLLCCVWGLQAQSKLDLKLTNKVTVNRDSDYVYAYTLPEPSTFSAHHDVWYHWYSGGTIKATRGGYDGKLLNGKFSCFYHNKNLEEQGLFKKGIKAGKWMSWYPSGELKSISHWRGGRQVRRSYHYNEQHQLVKVYKYRRGEAILKHPKPVSKKKVAKDSTKAGKKVWWNPFKKKKADKTPKVKKNASPKTALLPDGNNANAPKTEKKEVDKKQKDKKEKKAKKDKSSKSKETQSNPIPSTPIPVQKDTMNR